MVFLIVQKGEIEELQGMVDKQAYAQGLMRTSKEEVDLQEYQDFDDALANIKTFIESLYNSKHIHSWLGYLTPAEFEANWHRREGTD